MKILLLYMLLLKATISTFSGLASLPLLRNFPFPSIASTCRIVIPSDTPFRVGMATMPLLIPIGAVTTVVSTKSSAVSY